MSESSEIESTRDQVTAERRLADLMHLIKSPLAAAVGYADLMRRRPLDDETARLAERVYGLLRKTLRSTRLLNLLSNLETNTPTVYTRRFAVEDFIVLVSRCVQEVHVAISPSRRIQIELNIADNLNIEKLAVAFDPDLIEQVIICLLDNAVKYSEPEKDIHVVIFRTPTHLIVEVTNTGIVVTPFDASMALKRGWRGLHAKMIDVEGSGIGLYLADAIAKAHGGTVSLEPTNTQKRTVASFNLPIITTNLHS